MTQTQTNNENNLTHTNDEKNKQPNFYKLERKFIEKKDKNITKYLTAEQKFKKHEHWGLPPIIVANRNVLLK